jgi:hypothetical protein
MNFFKEKKIRAVDAQYEAQKIAFGPVIFQAVKSMRDLGVLSLVADSGSKGITQNEIVAQLNVSEYGVRVLLEAGLGIGVVHLNESDKYVLSKVGYFILNDTLTQVNLDFTHDVCYLGLFNLKESIENGKPEGLKALGTWNTVYEGLSQLPDHIKKSWFDFDHYYSDNAFPEVLPHIFKHKPKSMLDIGGNTGKFSMMSAKYDQDVKMTIVDLPGQWGMAKKNIDAAGLSERVFGFPCNLLDPAQPLPKGPDAIWMSQFLDCFSEKEIISILERCAESIDENGAIYILETYWDRQKYEASAFSLQMTSLYFTAIANGNSQMYHSKDMIRCIHAAGLYVEEDTDGIGISHTLFRCKKKNK